MKRLAVLLTLALSLAPASGAVAHPRARALHAPCQLATPADLAAAKLSPVETLGEGPAMCNLVWSGPPQVRAMNVFVRSLKAIGKDEDSFGPGMCAKALATSQKQKTASCRELSGYGKFAVLITTNRDAGTGRFATILTFVNAQNRLTIMATGVPGGDTPAVERLGKVLAAKYP